MGVRERSCKDPALPSSWPLELRRREHASVRLGRRKVRAACDTGRACRLMQVKGLSGPDGTGEDYIAPRLPRRGCTWRHAA